MFDLTKVTTVKGEVVSRTACRRISGDYYKVGDTKVKGSGDCYFVNDKYYREDTGYIVYDEFLKEYVINNSSVLKGIIGLDEEDNITIGYFSKNPLYNTRLYINSSVQDVMDVSILENNRKYRLHLEKDVYYDITRYRAVEFNALPVLRREEKTSLPYNCDGVIDSFKAAYDKAEFKPSEITTKYAESLQGLTYGFEFETVLGKVPTRLTEALGLIPLRDGSIAGLEYATIPYSGVKGLEATRLVCNALDKYTTYDDNCSLHLHVGGIPRTKEFLVALFKVLGTLQDEVFSLFPLYKKYNFGVKEKNYTKPLPTTKLLSNMDPVITKSNINSNFDQIFKFLSMGISMEDYGHNLDKVTSHPSDPGGRSKWNIRSRYQWVNFIPIVFGNKQTVEFRIHTPTTDFNKVSAYLFLCCGIINYVKRNESEILKGRIPTSLNAILTDVYRGEPALLALLCKYITRRRDITYSQNSEGNIQGDEAAIESVDLFDEKVFAGYRDRLGSFGYRSTPSMSEEDPFDRPGRRSSMFASPPPVFRSTRGTISYGMTAAGIEAMLREVPVTETISSSPPDAVEFDDDDDGDE